ncbi:MAG: lysophospholipid acyltransferase family protein, partial [Erythrobacter sp.]|nr:lysophospholipid acyltransferase family protein [Erythrobacter sp.]
MLYRWKGWTIEGALPKNLKKYVIAGAPHTSNWDFVFFAGATKEEAIQPNFMGKHTLFEGVMKNFMLDMGGIPVDRTKRGGTIEQMKAEFARRKELALVIAAEGSRTSDGKWKSGFYNIANAAAVPIVPAYADNEKMIIGFGEPLMPTGNYGEDLLKLAQWFRSKLPDYE